jgi:hypothetical protein
VSISTHEVAGTIIQFNVFSTPHPREDLRTIGDGRHARIYRIECCGYESDHPYASELGIFLEDNYFPALTEEGAITRTKACTKVFFDFWDSPKGYTIEWERFRTPSLYYYTDRHGHCRQYENTTPGEREVSRTRHVYLRAVIRSRYDPNTIVDQVQQV